MNGFAVSKTCYRILQFPRSGDGSPGVFVALGAHAVQVASSRTRDKENTNNVMCCMDTTSSNKIGMNFMMEMSPMLTRTRAGVG